LGSKEIELELDVRASDARHATAAILDALGMDPAAEGIRVDRAYIVGRVLCLDLTAEEDDRGIVDDHSMKVTLHLDTLKLTHEGVCVGYLHQSDDKGIPVINCDLAGFDRNLKAGMRWLTTRPTDEEIFQTKGLHQTLTIINSNDCILVLPPTQAIPHDGQDSDQAGACAEVDK
jgi:hypothetical protein